MGRVSVLKCLLTPNYRLFFFFSCIQMPLPFFSLGLGGLEPLASAGKNKKNLLAATGCSLRFDLAGCVLVIDFEFFSLARGGGAVEL